MIIYRIMIIMEGLQEQMEKLLNIITFLLVKLDEVDVDTEIKLILDKSRNEVALIQHYLLEKCSLENGNDSPDDNFNYDNDPGGAFESDSDKTDVKKEGVSATVKLEVLSEDQSSADSAIKINFKKVMLENKPKRKKCSRIRKRNDVTEDMFTKVRKCNRCDDTVNDKSDLREHLDRVHNIKLKKFAHFEDSTRVILQCKECDYSSHRLDTLRKHIRTHLPNFDPCYICGRIPKSVGALIRHVEKHTEHPSVYEKVGKRQCSTCKKKFPVETFDDHTCETTTFVCNICGKVYESKSGLFTHHKYEHEKKEIPKPFICTECGAGFQHKSALKTHTRSHEEKTPCPQCGMKVRKVKLHIEAVHTPDEMKKHQCQDCGKGFLDALKLESHRMSVHLKLKPHNCRYGCKISYNDISNRNQHEKKTHGKLFTTIKEQKVKARMEES